MNKYLLQHRRSKIHVLQAVVRYSVRSCFASWGEIVSTLKVGRLGNPSSSKETLRDMDTASGALDSIISSTSSTTSAKEIFSEELAL
jgi:hypothetical protein